MSRTIEIPDGIYNALERAAQAGGTTPIGWIEARLAEVSPIADDAPDPKPGRTLADLFAGRIGRIRSGVTERTSDRVGDDFAEYLEEKKRQGCL